MYGALSGCMPDTHQRPGEAIGSPELGDIEGCELTHTCWELKLSPVEKQPVLCPSEPSFQPLSHHLYHVIEVPVRPLTACLQDSKTQSGELTGHNRVGLP